MRTLQSFISYLTLILLVGGLSYLIGREVLLIKAGADLQNLVAQMERIDRSRGEYEFKCRQKGGASATDVIQAIQIRFLDSNEYVMEVVCQFFASDPIIVTKKKLPIYVTKVPGESGIIWDVTGRSGISLEALGTYRTLIVDGVDVSFRRGLQAIDGNKPPSVCQGFGYKCCDAITEIGEGQTLSEVRDCTQNCFQACRPRPLVLKFSSDPAVDLQAGFVEIAKDTPISFYYVVDPGEATSITQTIDFGDGNREQRAEIEGMVTHSYSCPINECRFTATLQAEDQHGTSSVITRVSTIEVVVR